MGLSYVSFHIEHLLLLCGINQYRKGDHRIRLVCGNVQAAMKYLPVSVTKVHVILIFSIVYNKYKFILR